MKILLVICSISLGFTVQAATLRQNEGEFYLKTIRFLARYEEEGIPKNQDHTSLLSWIIPATLADSNSCIIAGYIGTMANGACQFPANVSYSRGGPVTCNPELFGSLSLHNPDNSRWTRACGEALLTKAGVKKDIDSNLSESELKQLGTFLADNKIDPEALMNSISEVCKTAEASKKYWDITRLP